MPNDDKIKAFVTEARRRGATDLQIKANLAKRGVAASQVNSALGSKSVVDLMNEQIYAKPAISAAVQSTAPTEEPVAANIEQSAPSNNLQQGINQLLSAIPQGQPPTENAVAPVMPPEIGKTTLDLTASPSEYEQNFLANQEGNVVKRLAEAPESFGSGFFKGMYNFIPDIAKGALNTPALVTDVLGYGVDVLSAPLTRKPIGSGAGSYLATLADDNIWTPAEKAISSHVVDVVLPKVKINLANGADYTDPAVWGTGLGQAVGQIGTLIATKGKSAAPYITSFLGAYNMGLESAKAEGLSPQQARALSSTVAAVTTWMDNSFGAEQLILSASREGAEQALKPVVAEAAKKIATDGLTHEALSEASTIYLKGYRQFLADIVKHGAVEMSKEAADEFTQGIVEGVAKSIFNYAQPDDVKMGKGKVSDALFVRPEDIPSGSNVQAGFQTGQLGQYAFEGTIGGIIGAATGGLSTGATRSDFAPTVFGQMNKAVQSGTAPQFINLLNASLDQNVTEGVITPEQAATAKKDIGTMGRVAAMTQHFDDPTGAKRYTYYDAIRQVEDARATVRATLTDLYEHAQSNGEVDMAMNNPAFKKAQEVLRIYDGTELSPQTERNGYGTEIPSVAVATNKDGSTSVGLSEKRTAQPGLIAVSAVTQAAVPKIEVAAPVEKVTEKVTIEPATQQPLTNAEPQSQEVTAEAPVEAQQVKQVTPPVQPKVDLSIAVESAPDTHKSEIGVLSTAIAQSNAAQAELVKMDGTEENYQSALDAANAAHQVVVDAAKLGGAAKKKLIAKAAQRGEQWAIDTQSAIAELPTPPVDIRMTEVVPIEQPTENAQPEVVPTAEVPITEQAAPEAQQEAVAPVEEVRVAPAEPAPQPKPIVKSTVRPKKLSPDKVRESFSPETLEDRVAEFIFKQKRFTKESLLRHFSAAQMFADRVALHFSKKEGGQRMDLMAQDMADAGLATSAQDAENRIADMLRNFLGEQGGPRNAARRYIDDRMAQMNGEPSREEQRMMEQSEATPEVTPNPSVNEILDGMGMVDNSGEVVFREGIMTDLDGIIATYLDVDDKDIANTLIQFKDSITPDYESWLADNIQIDESAQEPLTEEEAVTQIQELNDTTRIENSDINVAIPTIDAEGEGSTLRPNTGEVERVGENQNPPIATDENAAEDVVIEPVSPEETQGLKTDDSGFQFGDKVTVIGRNGLRNTTGKYIGIDENGKYIVAIGTFKHSYDKGDIAPVATFNKATEEDASKRSNLKKIVLDSGNGMIINDLFNEWDSIKNEEQQAQWEEKVRNTSFGTYGTKSLMDTIKLFDPKGLHEVTKKNFYNSIEDALGIPESQKTYKAEAMEVPPNYSEESIDHATKQVDDEIEAAKKRLDTAVESRKRKKAELVKSAKTAQQDIFDKPKGLVEEQGIDLSRENATAIFRDYDAAIANAERELEALQASRESDIAKVIAAENAQIKLDFSPKLQQEQEKLTNTAPKTKQTHRQMERVTGRLKSVFKGVEVVTDIAQIDAALAEMQDQNILPKNIEVKGRIMGFVYDGKVYIDPRVADISTPIHEFGHVWNQICKENFPALWNAGKQQMKGSEYEARVKKNYAGQIAQMRTNGATEQEIEDFIADEALATAIGEEGARLEGSALERFKGWLNRLWTRIKTTFGMHTSLEQMSPDRIGKMTMQEFVNATAKRLLNGGGIEVSQLTPEGEKKFQIVGEMGAAFWPEKLDYLYIAQQMENNERPARDIYLATGWERGVDGFWRVEVDDPAIKLPKMKGDATFREGVAPLSEVWPEIAKVYPNIGSINVRVNMGDQLKQAGHFTPTSFEIYATGKTDQEIRSVLLHEIQHAIQEKEGFAKGSNPASINQSEYKDVAISKINKDIEALEKQLPHQTQSWINEVHDPIVAQIESLEDKRRSVQNSDAAYRGYMATAGEVEARNVQSRASLSPEERASRPFSETEDVARDEQIITNAQSATRYQLAPGTPDAALIVDDSVMPSNTETARYNGEDRILNWIAANINADPIASAQNIIGTFGRWINALNTIGQTDAVAANKAGIQTKGWQEVYDGLNDVETMQDVAAFVNDPEGFTAKNAGKTVPRMGKGAFAGQTVDGTVDIELVQKIAGVLFGHSGIDGISKKYGNAMEAYADFHRDNILHNTEGQRSWTRQAGIQGAANIVKGMVERTKADTLLGKASNAVRRFMMGVMNLETFGKAFFPANTTGYDIFTNKYREASKKYSPIVKDGKIQLEQVGRAAKNITTFGGENTWKSVEKKTVDAFVWDLATETFVRRPVTISTAEAISLVMIYDTQMASYGKSSLIVKDGQKGGAAYTEKLDGDKKEEIFFGFNDSAEIDRLRREIEGNPETKAAYDEIKSAFNDDKRYDAIRGQYEALAGKPLERVTGEDGAGSYFMLSSAAVDTDTEQKISSEHGRFVDSVSILKNRATAGDAVRLQDAVSHLQQYMNNTDDFLLNSETVFNIARFLDTTAEIIQSERSGMGRREGEKVVKLVTRMASALNNYRSYLKQFDRTSAQKWADRLQRNFVLARFALNVALPAKQYFGYLGGFGLDIVSDKHQLAQLPFLTGELAKTYGTQFLFPSLNTGSKIEPELGQRQFDKLYKRVEGNPYASEVFNRLVSEYTADTELVTSIQQMANHGVLDKERGALASGRKFVDEYGMYGVRRVDRAVILAQYMAAESQVLEESGKKNPADLTDAELERVGDLATRLMYATNVMYAVGTRSFAQLDKSFWAKIFGVFTGQSQRMINTIMSAHYDARNGVKGAKKQLRASALTMGVVNNFAMWGVGALALILRGMASGNDEWKKKKAAQYMKDAGLETVKGMASFRPGLGAELFKFALDAAMGSDFENSILASPGIEQYEKTVSLIGQFARKIIDESSSKRSTKDLGIESALSTIEAAGLLPSEVRRILVGRTTEKRKK